METQHQPFTIKQLSNKELLFQTKLLVQKERSIHIQVLRHLAEVDSRKLYFKQGFFSLFDYSVRELGYSEGAAFRRIKAMKLCRDLPETAKRLQSGRLSLSSASQLQVFFEKQNKKIKEDNKKALKSHEGRVSKNEVKELKKSGEERGLINSPEKKVLKRKETGEDVKMRENCQDENLNRTLPLSQKAKESLIKKVEGCSTRATEKLLSEVDPSLSLPKKEKIRFLGKGKVEIKVIIDEKCYKDLEKLKNLLSHRNPNLSYGELISILSKEALKKHNPREKNTRKREEKKVQEIPSIKKQGSKDRSVELTATFAQKPGQKNETSEHSEALSEKSVTSTKFEESKLSREASLLRRSVTFAQKPGQKNETSEHSEALSEKSVASAKFEESKTSREASLLRRSVTFAQKPGQKNETSEHSEALSEKSVASAKFEESKLSREASLLRRSVTFAQKPGQKNETSEHSEALSEKSVASAKFEESKTSREASLLRRPVTFTPKSGQISQYPKLKSTFTQKSGHQIKKLSRYIPSQLRKYIWERDKGQCAYVHYETKRRCTCRHLLQIDHIQPFALGGRSEKDNLRLLCAGHNQYRR